jgi:hypothetical protein
LGRGRSHVDSSTAAGDRTRHNQQQEDNVSGDPSILHIHLFSPMMNYTLR